MVERKKRMVIPSALRIVRLKPARNYCRLGELSSRVGWSHGDLVARLEEKRKTRSGGYYQKKKETLRMQREAKQFAQGTLPKDQVAFLQQYGHA